MGSSSSTSTSTTRSSSTASTPAPTRSQEAQEKVITDSSGGTQLAKKMAIEDADTVVKDALDTIDAELGKLEAQAHHLKTRSRRKKSRTMRARAKRMRKKVGKSVGKGKGKSKHQSPGDAPAAAASAAATDTTPCYPDGQVVNSVEYSEEDSLHGKYNDLVTVTCMEGYELVPGTGFDDGTGIPKAKCGVGESTVWVTPVCRAVMCADTHMRKSSHADAKIKGAYGDKVKVWCLQGYTNCE